MMQTFALIRSWVKALLFSHMYIYISTVNICVLFYIFIKYM